MLQARIEQLPQTPGMEGGRRPTGVTGVETKPTEVEVVARKTRRRLTIGYKIRVIETVAELKANGSSSIGSYLRKEGLYYSSVRKWIEQQERGELSSTKSGGKTKSRAVLQAEIHRLRRQLESTEKKLKKTELIVELQKKLSLILGLDQVETDEKKAEQ
jgi:transposase-like protein